MRLLLIRHGESEHSVRGLVAGMEGCPGLTASGRAQAGRLADRLAREYRRVDALICSPVLRARETAEILASRGLTSVGIQADCDLCEMHIGEGDGLSSTEFAARYGSFDPRMDPDRPVSPGGDCWTTFSLRVRRTLIEIAERHPGETLAVVTHAGFIVQAFMELFAVPRPGTGTRVDPDFASLTEWEHDQDQSLAHFWRLVRFNDTAHLSRA